MAGIRYTKEELQAKWPDDWQKRSSKGILRGVAGLQGEKVVKKKKIFHDINKNGLSERQLKNIEEFLKVRPGETHEKWERRTRRRRIISDEEAARTSAGKKKIRLAQKKKKTHNRSQANYKKKIIKIETAVAEYDFLKHLLPVMTWASHKYEITIQDLMLCFYFHKVPPFTKEQFNSKCILFSKGIRGVHRRFFLSGYIVKLASKNRKQGTYTVPIFKLSAEMTMRINNIYRKLAHAETFSETREELFKKTVTHPETKGIADWLLEMNRDTRDILKGDKQPEIIIHKNDLDEL